MGQVSSKLRTVGGQFPGERGYSHWCPGCEEMHVIWTARVGDHGINSWQFDGNLDAPTFSPSVRVTYNGPDAGQMREGGHRAPHACCHYFLRAGQLQFCGDSTHALAGKTLPLPLLPAELTDT